MLTSRQWHPIPVLLSGKSHGRRSLEGCSPWGCWGLDKSERLHFHISLSCIGEGNGNPLQCSCLENPRDAEPGGLPSLGSHRVWHDWSDLAAAALHLLWKILKEMGIPDHLTCLLRNLYSGQEATVRSGHGTTDWFQIRKEYIKAVYCHPAYLTYMQSTSWEMLGWRKHKLESRLLGEISITLDR